MDPVVTMFLKLQRERVKIESVMKLYCETDHQPHSIDYWVGKLDGVNLALEIVNLTPWIMLRS